MGRGPLLYIKKATPGREETEIVSHDRQHGLTSGAEYA